MTALWEVTASWPARGLLAGGMVLLAGRLAVSLSRRPTRRAWFGTAAVVAALLAIPLSALPGWLRIAVPNEGSAPAVATVPDYGVRPDTGTGDLLARGGESVPAQAGSPASETEGSPATVVGPEQLARPAQVPERTPAAPSIDWAAVAGGAYCVIAGFFLVRLLAGHGMLARLWRRARPAPTWADDLFRRLAAPICRRARLRVSSRPAGPICFGVVRPRVLVPASLLAAGDGPGLRAVFAHELAHLGRHDPLAGWLLGLARAVYFVFPWLPGLRREVRVAQECLADADAAREATGPASYAELLIRMARSRPAPLGAAGARGPGSELFRRVTMLLRTDGRDERRCPRRWALAVGGGLTALAVLAAGLSIQPRPAAAAEPEKGEPAKKKEADKKEPAKADPFKEMLDHLKEDLKGDPEAIKRLEEMFKEAQRPVGPPADNKVPPGVPPRPGFQPPAGPPDFDKELEAAQDLLRQQMEMLQQQLQAGGGVRAGGFVLGPGGFRPLPAAGVAGGRAGLGITVERPSDVLTSQLDLPVGQGQVAVDVPAQSVAGKAGIRPNDVLVELGGKSVSSNFPDFQKMLADIKPDTAVDIVVVRKGKKETIKGVTLPEARPVAGLPRLAFPAAPRAALAPVVPVAPPALPAAPVGRRGPAAGPGDSTRVEQVNDAFTVFHSKNGVKVTIAGTKEGGVAKAESIEIDDNGKTTRAESIDKLPKEYQEMAATALKAVK